MIVPSIYLVYAKYKEEYITATNAESIEYKILKLQQQVTTLDSTLKIT